jgi:ComF family protein
VPGPRPRFPSRAWSELLDAFYPPLCPLCGDESPEGVGCARHRLGEGASGHRCRACGQRLADCLPDGSLCAACRRSSPGYQGLLALADYRADAGTRAWILAFKHGGRRDLAAPLGRRLVALWHSRVSTRERRDALLVPVPLHPLRRIERGYDQALLLARALAEASGRESRSALRRRRWTPPQGSPGSSSRSANVRGAFRLRRGLASALEERAVWLVDDVVTSGATVAACAAELRRGGAREVSVLCLARVESESTVCAAGLAAPPGPTP